MVRMSDMQNSTSSFKYADLNGPLRRLSVGDRDNILRCMIICCNIL